ncbi:hypothetical protein BDR26DRAFT_874644 [Obelidium mucronatum]|nr:hypothetical protein BDR26DRAFT_874644 [Obelidium mucronatum]
MFTTATIKNSIIVVLVHLAVVNATLCQCICSTKTQYYNTIFDTDACTQQACYNRLKSDNNKCLVSDYETKDLTGIVAGGVVGGLIFIALVITCLWCFCRAICCCCCIV